MTGRLSLQRVSTVDALAAALRTRILDGDLAAGERLREQELADAYGVARHSLRAALRALSAEGLVTIEPNRGASVASLTPADLEPMFELRTALELEAATLALARHDHELPKAVHDAVRLMAAVCEQPDPPWSSVVEAHDAVHHALVAAAESPRILRAYEALAGEMRLFVIGLKPSWSLERMAEHHERLLAELERDGPEPLRRHIKDGAATLLLGPPDPLTRDTAN
jgi:DNA-binding GntR family transcriptional regulator